VSAGRTLGAVPSQETRGLGIVDAFVALSDGILITDALGRVESANPAAGRILGVDRLLGTVFEEQSALRGARTLDAEGGRIVRRAELPRDERPVTVEIVTTELPEGQGRRIHTLRDVTA